MRSSFTRPVRLVRAVPLGVLLAACADRGADQRAVSDSDLARDLALVQSTAAVQPIFRDTALTNAPERRAPTAPSVAAVRSMSRGAAVRETGPRQATRASPRPQPRRPTRVAPVPPPRPAEPTPRPVETVEATGGSAPGSIGAGAVLAATSDARVCSRTNLPGDRITATVNEPVRGTSGAEIPAGSQVVLEVVSIDARESGEQGQVVFRVTSVAVGDESYRASGGATASGRLETVAGPRNASADRKKVIGGAIAGAILGQMMGKDTRSTVIGAAAGAAAGTAAAKMGDKGESCLAAGTALRITLDEAVVMH